MRLPKSYAFLYRMVTPSASGVRSPMTRYSILSASVDLGLITTSLICSAQIDRSVQAHGSLAKWKSYGAVEFDLASENKRGTKSDHQLFNLRSRDGLITADAYTIGASKGEVWAKPGLDALGGTPPRFYMWTPFYFFAMPFVFADPGATQESLGKKTFAGQEYDAIKITFKAGTGDSPDDYYVAYIDSGSGRLKLASYVVTYPAVIKGKPLEQLEPHAILFDEWQEVGGLTVPKRAAYFNWKNENIDGEALGTMSFSNVRFSTVAPEDSKFKKPAEAVVAPLE